MSAIRRFIRNTIRIGGILLASVTVSACVYDGYGGGLNYRSSHYDCDPYASWSSYYSCDSGYGFSNIGYGGGWYDNYYYPGHGSYLFDRSGARRHMSADYQRYWARQRLYYQRSHRNDRNHRRNYDNRRDWRNHDGDRDRPRYRDGYADRDRDRWKKHDRSKPRHDRDQDYKRHERNNWSKGRQDKATDSKKAWKKSVRRRKEDWARKRD